jgi:hypothetical protein
MYFDINNYNPIVLVLSFLLVIAFLLIYFRNNFISIIDPLVLHIIWIASHLAFLFAYINKIGPSYLSLFFVFNTIFYIVFYKLFLINKNLKKSCNPPEEYNLIKTKYIFIALVVINLISKINFFSYALENRDLASWLLYRFIEKEGRNPLFRILSTASIVYLCYYTFLLVIIKKSWKIICISCLILILLIDVFAGGRSIMLNVIFNLGLSLFFFKDYVSNKIKSRFDLSTIVFILIALMSAITISAFMGSNNGFEDGYKIMLNRIFAAGDGLEYYMTYDGMKYIPSGVSEFVNSVFGIYLKHITGINYKNFGLQLSELMTGNSFDVTEGVNFTFLLQVMVLGYPSFIIYIPIIAFITSKLRFLNFKDKKLMPLSFFLSSTSFYLPLDVEFWILNIISGVLFFLIFIYPISKISLKK